jgi:hypothetical protein
MIMMMSPQLVGVSVATTAPRSPVISPLMTTEPKPLSRAERIFYKPDVPDTARASARTHSRRRNPFSSAVVRGPATWRVVDWPVLDGLLAKAAPPLPIIAGPLSSPVNRNYQIGTLDPPVSHDRGAGIWGSKPAEASYIALKQGIIQILPEAVVFVGPDAAKHMAHYLIDNNGKSLIIDLEGMVQDVPSAKARFRREVSQMQTFVETLPLGSVNPFTSKNVEVGYNTQAESKNWFFCDRRVLELGEGDGHCVRHQSRADLHRRVRVQVLRSLQLGRRQVGEACRHHDYRQVHWRIPPAGAGAGVRLFRLVQTAPDVEEGGGHPSEPA